MTNSAIKQRGNFTVEFAIIGLVFSLLFVFSGDVVIKLSYKGKLDRLSYSMVDIIKERTQLYDENYELTEHNVNTVINIARSSLARTISQFDSKKFGYLVEAVTFDSRQFPTYRVFPYAGGTSIGLQCTAHQPLNEMTHLSKITTWGRRSTLYRVTLCYDTDNWIGDLLGMEFSRVQSHAVIIGR